MRLPPLLLAVTLLLLGPSAASAQPAPPLAQRIPGDVVRAAGSNRLADLFDLVDGWRAVTVDGLTVQAAPLGAPTYARADWVLLIDGQRLAPDLFGLVNPEQLPVAVEEIDYVDVYALPVLLDGLPAPRGVVHVHTRPAADGAALDASAWVDNSVRDPGPFEYTRERTRNAEHRGPDVALRAALGRPRWSLRAAAVRRGQGAFDPVTSDRIKPVFRGFDREELDAQQIEAVGGRVHGRAAWGAVRLQAQALAARLDDFVFFAPFGREVPTVRERRAGRLEAAWALTPTLALEAEGAAQRTDAAERRNLLGVDPAWRQTLLTGRTALTATPAGTRLTLGGRVDAWDAETDTMLTDPRLTVGRVYGEVRADLGEAAGVEAAAAAAFAEGEAGLSATLQARWRPAPASTVTLHLAHAHRLPAEDGSLWFWRSRGYAFTTTQGMDVAAGRPAAPRLQSAALSGTHRLHPALTLSGALYARRTRGELAATQAFRFDPRLRAALSPVTLVPDVDGVLYGVRLQAAGALGRAVRHQLTYTLERASGDDVFRRRQRQAPDHRAAYQVLVRPNPRFRLFGRLRYDAAVYWPDYAGIEAEYREEMRFVGYNVPFTEALPAQWALDLAAQKRLAGEHAEVGLAVRNALNRPLRTHPAGLQQYMALALTLRLHW